jgi:hypothetical protein
MASFTPRPLQPKEKEPPVSIGQEAGWALELVWTLCSTEKYIALTGNRTPAVQPVTIPTEISLHQISN